MQNFSELFKPTETLPKFLLSSIFILVGDLEERFINLCVFRVDTDRGGDLKVAPHSVPIRSNKRYNF